MRSCFSRGLLAATIVLPALTGAAWAQVTDLDGCTNATLQGDYALTIQGQYDGIVTATAPMLHPFKSPVPINGLVMQHFDGNTPGTFTQVDFVMQGGLERPGPPPLSTGFTDNEHGTYTVFPDCTGTFTIMAGPVTVVVMFVLAKQGNEIHTVVLSLHVPMLPATATPGDSTICDPMNGCDLGVNVRSDGVKLGQPSQQ